LEVHKKVVREEIEIFNTANLIKACQRDLEQLDLTQQNRATLVEIQSEQQDLLKKIESAIKKLKFARDTEDQKLQETIDEHLVQVKAMRELLSETDFGNSPSIGFGLPLVLLTRHFAHLEAKRSRILAFIDPAEFMDDLELAQALRDEGTGLWLLQHPSLLKWLNAPAENVFWINGM